MIKGNNELRLNTATMLNIVQLWIDQETKLNVKVTGITYAGDNSIGIFTIRLTDSDTKEPGR